MSWCECVVLLAAAVSVYPAILPPDLAGAARTSTSEVALADRAVWNEYGLEASERASYGAATVTAYRFKDSTGAFAGRLWLNGDPAVSGMLAQIDNYLLNFSGVKFTPEQIQAFAAKLPSRHKASLPSLPAYFPARNVVPGSDRSLLGPASLAKFEPRLSASSVAFEKGAEAQVARYKLPTGEEQLLIINYPTPQIAMDRAKALQGIAGSVRRSGPLVVAVPAPVDKGAADALVAQVSYRPGIMWNEPAPVDVRKAGDMLLGICLLALGLMVGSIVFGVFLGGIRGALARARGDKSGQDFTSLHLTQPGS